MPRFISHFANEDVINMPFPVCRTEFISIISRLAPINYGLWDRSLIGAKEQYLLVDALETLTDAANKMLGYKHPGLQAARLDLEDHILEMRTRNCMCSETHAGHHEGAGICEWEAEDGRMCHCVTATHVRA